ncbi:MAG TPA: hypothetical protein VL358_11705 [Caulobacteraceae bacterium]|nr:hypothetical protein [Caulobacteraceae bacterium]
MWKGRGLIRALALGAALAGALVGSTVRAEAVPAGWQARNMKPLAHLTLPGPRAFKLSIKKSKGRWYLFVAEGGQSPALSREGRGFVVVDVTDPARPVVVFRQVLQNGSGQLTLHGDLLIAGLQPPFDPGAKHPTDGPWSDSKPAVNDLALLFDISDPVHPKRLSAWRTEGFSTHRNVYPGGKYAFMSAFLQGFRGQAIMSVLDVSDPLHPREVGRWWQPGQKEGEPPRAPPNGFHGPVTVSPDGKMLTMGYTPGIVNLDFTDPTHPKLIGKLDFAPLPQVGTQAIHTGLPLANGLMIVSIEPSAPGCADSAAWAALVDNKDPAHPRLVSYFPRPSPPPGAPYKSFCDKGGRVGPHNVNAEIHLPDAQAPGDLVFMTYFNAGIRVFDITDANSPQETGWFLPKIGSWESGERGMEDVLVDTRGNVFVTDGEAKGLWVLRYTNPKGPKLPIRAK